MADPTPSPAPAAGWIGEPRSWREVIRPMAEAYTVGLHESIVDICRRAGATVPEILIPEVFEAAVAAAESNVHMMLSMLREGLEPRMVGFPPASSEFARQCARAGLAVPTVIRIGNAGFSELWRDWGSLMRSQPTDDQLLADALGSTAQFLWAYIDVLYAHWSDEFMLERDRWLRSREALRAETIQAILDDRPLDVVAAGQRLGLDLTRPFRAFVVWTDARDDDILDALERHANAVAQTVSPAEPLIFTRSRTEICGWLAGGDAIAVAPVRRRLLAAAGGGVHVAFGNVRVGLAGFRRSHAEALAAAAVAGLGADRAAVVVEYRTVALLALLTADLQQARAFVEDELAGLAADDDATVRVAATLRVYLQEQGSPKRTAARLGIHENTVVYRIRQAEQLLGRRVDQRRAETEAALAIASALRRSDSEGP